MSCPSNYIFINIERKVCARACLAKSDCNCFTYDSNTKVCELKKDACFFFTFTSYSQRIYNKYASNKFLCGYGDCNNNDINIFRYNAQECSLACSSNPNCRLMALTSGPSKTCFVKSKLCDFTEATNQAVHVVSCINGNFLPESIKNPNLSINMLNDNSNDTCKNVNQSSNFNLKVPWPSAGKSKPDFDLIIIGKNLKKCLDSSDILQESFVIAYVV